MTLLDTFLRSLDHFAGRLKGKDGRIGYLAEDIDFIRFSNNIK